MAFWIMVGALAALGIFITLVNVFVWAFSTGCDPKNVHDTDYTPVKHIYCPLCGRAAPMKSIYDSLEFYVCRFGHKTSICRRDGTVFKSEPN